MKSLLDLIILTLKEKSSDIELAKKIERIIKDEAKSYFFNGKISSFVAFIFGEKNQEIETNFSENFIQFGINSSLFLPNIIQNIQNEVELHNLSKDLNGLLKLLGYEHLKPFISMFK